MLKTIILTTTAMAAMIAAPAYAQDAPATPENKDQPAKADTGGDIITTGALRRTDIIITATGAEQYPENTGQAVTVLTSALIEKRQTVALSDLLQTTPGVTVSRNGGLGTLTSVRIRGAEGDQTLTLIDGVRVNDPSSPGGGFDFANLLAGSIERVEVLRGPNSVPWGSQAIGGVINVVTKVPTYGLSGYGNVEYGSFNSVFANAGINGESGPFKGAFNAGYLRTDGISAAAIGTEPDGYRQYGANGRVEISLASNVKIDLRGYYADSKVEIDGFPAPNYTLADTLEFAKTQELYGYGALKVDLVGGDFKNRISFSIADINRDNFDPGFSNSIPLYFSRGRTERYEYQGDWRASEAIRLVGGVERENTRFTEGSVFKSRGVTSVYGEAIVTPVDRMTLTGGLRYDSDSAYGDRVSWGANAVYGVSYSTNLRASYAEGFKAPTLYQLYGPFGLGNPNLRPETAQSYDIGIEQKLFDQKLSVSLTWFHRDTTNQIDFDQNTFTYNNIARTRGQGVELALSARPTSELTLSGAFSYIDAQNRAAADANFGNDLARRPRVSGSASVDWTTPFKLNVGATVLSVGRSFDDAGNFNRLKGYTTLGLRADFPIGENFTLYGRVDNVFDEKYQVVRGYNTPGRAAYGGVRLRFN